MGETKQINIKNRTYYSYSNIIDFDAKLLKIDKKSHKNLDIYYIGYVNIKNIADYESIYSVNPLYLRIIQPRGYLEEENGNKYVIFDSVNENKDALKNTLKFGMDLKTKQKQ